MTVDDSNDRCQIEIGKRFAEYVDPAVQGDDRE